MPTQEFVTKSNQKILSGVYLFRPETDQLSIHRVEDSLGNQLFDINSIGGWVNIGPDQPQYEQDPNVSLYVVKDLNGYHAINIMNPNSGSLASSDMVVVNDDPDSSRGFIDVGMTSSNFADPNYAVYGAGEGYLWTASGNLFIGTGESGKSIVFFTGGLDSVNYKRGIIDGNGNFGIGTVSPNANAILDLTSTTKAFMPPRMTTTQRDLVASPTEGMIIYNTTTHVLNHYNGSSWGAV